MPLPRTGAQPPAPPPDAPLHAEDRHRAALAYRATLVPASEGAAPLAGVDAQVSTGPAPAQRAPLSMGDPAVAAILAPDQPLPQPAHRADGPPQTATAPPTPPSQISHAVLSTTDRQIDLTLAPEELGRVKLTLHQDGEVMRVHIVADRPETLDLLRRHVGDLAQDLRAAGHEGASFSFAGSSREQPARPPGTAATDTDTDTDTDPPPPPRAAPQRGHDGALDLRL